MYQVHHDATSLPVDLRTDDYTQGSEKIPAVSASASRDAQGRVHVSLVNLDPRAAVSMAATIQGLKLVSATGRVLTADTLDAHNTVDAPNRVQPAAFTGATLRDSTLEARLPPRSIVVLTLAAGPS
jgi:alpha-N-arabinofuranosidase